MADSDSEVDDVELGFLEPSEGGTHLDFENVKDWDGGKVGGRPVSCVFAQVDAIQHVVGVCLPHVGRNGWILRIYQLQYYSLAGTVGAATRFCCSCTHQSMLQTCLTATRKHTIGRCTFSCVKTRLAS
jgi:hypothetical protein